MLLTLLVSRCSSKIGVEMAGMSAVCWHQWWSNGSVLGIVVVEGGVEAIGAMVVRGEVVELTTLERGSGDESEDTTNDTEGGRPPVPLMIMMGRKLRSENPDAAPISLYYSDTLTCDCCDTGRCF